MGGGGASAGQPLKASMAACARECVRAATIFVKIASDNFSENVC